MPQILLMTRQRMTALNDIAGQAALTICESLLLALVDRKILPEKEITGLLRDAAAAHEFVPDDIDSERHAAIAAVINTILERRTAPSKR
jgi:hypothetical protein